jgi:hypothetical protein
VENDGTVGTSRRYWLLVLALIALGALTIFSVGLYFWFIAVGLAVMSPFRARPGIFRPGMAFFVGFLLGYVLVAPLGCSQTMEADPVTGVEAASEVVCTSPIGVQYSGDEPFDPSVAPALLVASATGIIASAAVIFWSRAGGDGGSRRPRRAQPT